MTELAGAPLVVAVVFMVAFWGAVIWLFVSKPGNAILRFFAYAIVSIGLAACAYLRWEPYMAMICLPVGFIAGAYYTEWYYGIHHLTAPRPDQKPPYPPADHRAHLLQSQFSTPDSGHGAPLIQIDPLRLPPR